MDAILKKTQKYNDGNEAFEALTKEWDTLVQLVEALAIPEETQDLDAKKEVLEKHKRSTNEFDEKHQARWDTFLGFLKKEVTGLNITICRYETAAGNTAIAIGVPVTVAKSKFFITLPGRPERLSWDVMPLELAEWFEAWRIWYRAACSAQDQEQQLISLIRMSIDETWTRETRDKMDKN